jgi:hypothetical protein
MLPSIPMLAAPAYDISSLEAGFRTAMTATGAAPTQLNLDRQAQVSANEMIIIDIRELNQAVQRLSESIMAQPEGPLGMSARNWTRVKYMTAGGLAVFGCITNLFTAISFVSDVVTGQLFLQATEVLRLAEEDPIAKEKQSIQNWVTQDEASFWKS